MKILAIEQEEQGVVEEQFQPHLEAEAAAVWQLYQNGVIRELYFRKDREEAVFVLECATTSEAKKALGTLPLVKAGLISFEFIPLKAYPGFERLFSPGVLGRSRTKN